jgi:putative ABC transport system permease protein
MILKNLQFTLRNFRTQKLFTFVNVAGLILGIVAVCLILIYISFELSYDRFNKNADLTFRVYSTSTREGVSEGWVQTPAPFASFLQNKFPQIAQTVRIASIEKGLVSAGNFLKKK